MNEPFYITTPIYYVNDEPHVGHAYATVLADVMARYARLRGVDPRRHADETVVRFQQAWERLGITNDDFIRTTEPRHRRVVEAVLRNLWDRGEIYRGEYEGWYCVPDERFWTEKDLASGNCPDCDRPVERIVEPNYFFRMSAYQDWLIDYVNANPDFIQPEIRRNEVLGFLRRPLGDLCISRPASRLRWGIPLPFDPDYDLRLVRRAAQLCHSGGLPIGW